jgi:hypothetical protein
MQMPKIAPEKLHFLACLPEQLEQKLLQSEIAYLHKRYPNRQEDDIEATNFKLIRTSGGKYEPVVDEQKVK